MAAAFLVCIPAGAEAHSTAVYAGLYIIDMQAMPLAPLVGDPMHFNFQVYDLRYVHYAKPLKANLEITDPTTGGAIFITSSTLLTDGKFSADFTFPRQGIFNVTLNTWKPDEPNVIRDATFAIQVRNAPVPAESPWHVWGSGFGAGLGIGALVLWSMQFAHRKRKARHA